MATRVMIALWSWIRLHSAEVSPSQIDSKPPRFRFRGFFNNCKGGQHIRNRGSDHTGQHNYTCHDTFFAAVEGVERTCIAAVTVPLPLGLSRKLPAAKSSHRYGDSVHCIHGNNSHDCLLHTVVADGSALMVHSSIGKKIRNDRRSWMSARVTW